MQHAPYACGNADHRHLPAPDPFPVKGRRGRSPSGLPFRPFGPVERFPNFRAHWNCRAEPDTGHGLAEGPRAAHSRGPGGPRAPRPQQAATPPSRVGGGPGTQRTQRKSRTLGRKRGGREERPADVHGPPGAPRGRASRPGLPLQPGDPSCWGLTPSAPFSSQSGEPPAYHHPDRAPPRHLHVSAGHLHRLLVHLQAHGTREAAQGVGLRRGSCQLRTTITGRGLRLRRHLAAADLRASAAEEEAEGRSESGEGRSGRGLWNVCRVGGGASGRATPPGPSDAREKCRSGSRDCYEWRRVCASATFAQNLNGCYYYFGEGNGDPLQYSCLENPMTIP